MRSPAATRRSCHVPRTADCLYALPTILPDRLGVPRISAKGRTDLSIYLPELRKDKQHDAYGRNPAAASAGGDAEGKGGDDLTCRTCEKRRGTSENRSECLAERPTPVGLWIRLIGASTGQARFLASMPPCGSGVGRVGRWSQAARSWRRWVGRQVRLVSA